MMPFNEWLTKKLPIVREYFHKVGQTPPTTPFKPAVITREAELNSMGVIHNFLEDTMKSTEQSMLTHKEFVDAMKELIYSKPFPPFMQYPWKPA